VCRDVRDKVFATQNPTFVLCFQTTVGAIQNSIVVSEALLTACV
jgi:hypothetical protein